MNKSDFMKKIEEHLVGLDLKKTRQFGFEADGGNWLFKTGMYEDIVEVRVSFLSNGKMLKAWVYEEGDRLLIQPF
jgi:hypothetical protein